MNSNKKLFDGIYQKLIVSCQAEGNSPFNNPDDMVKFAQSAVNAGAAAIRSQGVEKTLAIIDSVNVPVIGLIKSEFEDGSVKITGSIEHVEKLNSIGCDIIAIDGTFRTRENHTGPSFIKLIKEKYNCLVMADISTLDEAIACQDSGADCVSTTLHGYTPETFSEKSDTPNFILLEQLVKNCKVPIIAEGRYNTPIFAAEAIEKGAWSVVVGTAITRPQTITQWFVDQIEKRS
jgi:N-acylglucosamine-6-phosphate 2-epimerase